MRTGKIKSQISIQVKQAGQEEVRNARGATKLIKEDKDVKNNEQNEINGRQVFGIGERNKFQTRL